MRELLPVLPAELRSNYTFVYESRSPHGGLGVKGEGSVSPLFPRTILFSADGKLALAFTGKPGATGYDVLEVIRFVDKRAAFVLSKFDLRGKTASLDNPPECLRCHGQDPRPIFDSYPLWPGFFGSIHDTFPPGSEELPLYQVFLKKQKSSKASLYSQLLWQTDNPVAPYLPPERFEAGKLVAEPGNLAFQPNTRLGMAWTELNRRRLFRKLKESPKYDAYKYRLLAGLLECTKLPVGEVRERSVQTRLEVENRDRLKRLHSSVEGVGSGKLNMMELRFTGNLSEISYVADLLEVKRHDWSMAFEVNSLSFFDGILSGVSSGKSYYVKEDFLFEMLADLTKKDFDLAPFFEPAFAYAEAGVPFGLRLGLDTARKACDVLETKTKAEPALPEVLAAPYHAEFAGSSAAAELPGALRSCSTCHEGESTIALSRPIPFGNRRALAARLGELSSNGETTLYEEILARVTSNGFRRMPPKGDRLEDNEIQALTQYLDETLKH